MKKYIINYEDGAKSDILSIIDYIEKEYDDSFNAMKVAVRIFKRCETLAHFPKSFPVHREWSSRRKFRAVHIKGYTIIYYIDDDEMVVNIRAVIHSRRDIVGVMKNR